MDVAFLSAFMLRSWVGVGEVIWNYLDVTGRIGWRRVGIVHHPSLIQAGCWAGPTLRYSPFSAIACSRQNSLIKLCIPESL